jgi:hypothetical protein
LPTARWGVAESLNEKRRPFINYLLFLFSSTFLIMSLYTADVRLPSRKGKHVSESSVLHYFSCIFTPWETLYVLYCLRGYKKDTNKRRGYIIYLYLLFSLNYYQSLTNQNFSGRE